MLTITMMFKLRNGGLSRLINVLSKKLTQVERLLREISITGIFSVNDAMVCVDEKMIFRRSCNCDSDNVHLI